MTGEYSSADLRRILRLDGSKLRACLRAALLPIPQEESSCTYSFQNLVVLRTAKGLTEAGVSVARIRRSSNVSSGNSERRTPSQA